MVQRRFLNSIAGLLLVIWAVSALAQFQVTGPTRVSRIPVAGGAAPIVDPNAADIITWHSGQDTNAVAILDDGGGGWNATNFPNMATGPTRNDALYTNENAETTDVWTYDGSDDDNVAGRVPGLTNRDVSFRAWIRPHATASSGVIMASGDNTGGRGKGMTYASQRLAYQYWDGANLQFRLLENDVGGTRTPVGMWHFVMITVSDITNVVMYINTTNSSYNVLNHQAVSDVLANEYGIAQWGRYTGTFYGQFKGEIFDPVTYKTTITDTNDVQFYWENTHPENYKLRPQ